MRIWPIVLDSHPPYMGGSGPGGSLLLAPFGGQTLLNHVRTLLTSVTWENPLVVATDAADAAYQSWIQTACPGTKVGTTPQEVADRIAAFELSDALLILDPRSVLLRSVDLEVLVSHYTAEPRLAHHLVVLETGVAGTKERVSFDASGQVRKILRHYESTTWSFIAGVSATLLPVASGILADGVVPATLGDLRQLLVMRGVPSRDLSARGGTIDLTEEAGLLAANEYAVRKVVGTGSHATPLLLGDGQGIHPTARLVGPIVVHAGARIDEQARIVGPAVIGKDAHVSAGAVVAHSVVPANAIVPAGAVVRDRVWSKHIAHEPASAAQAASHSAQLARAMASARVYDTPAYAETDTPVRLANLGLKRTLDVVVAATALVVLSPVLLITAAAVWLESRGPIFYGDKREGMSGRDFLCWKFRTMFVGAHAVQKDLQGLDRMDGPHFKVDRDPRVSRVGRVLRALNLDELPQLFNVLMGEMSLVGPRPSPFRENQVCVPWREARLSVRPGITGFWQVCRHDRAAGDFHQWIEYDLLYVQHLSFLLDVKILAATALTLGGKLGAVPAAWLAPSAVADKGPNAPVPSRGLHQREADEQSTRTISAPVRRAS